MPLVKTMFKDPKPWRSKEYREWVSTFPCCLMVDAWWMPEKRGEIGLSDPHHEAEPGEKGMSSKPGDEHCCPISHVLHRKMESPGNSRHNVWLIHGIYPSAVKMILWELWRRKWGVYPGNAEKWIEKWSMSEDLPKICPTCLDELLTWLDRNGDDTIKAIEALTAENSFMETELKEVVNHFRFIALRIRALDR